MINTIKLSQGRNHLEGVILVVARISLDEATVCGTTVYG